MRKNKIRDINYRCEIRDMRNNFTPISHLLSLICLFLSLISYLLSPICLYGQEIHILYKDAMESFYNKDYKEAIQYWEKILEMKPDQKNPPILIKMARAKMQENIKPLTEELNKLLREGNYLEAIPKLGELLELDPTNPTWLKSKEKLEKFTKDITPQITKKGKIPELLRKSVDSYLGREKDERIAVLASRYALQLDRGDNLSEKVFIFMEKEFTTIARLDVMHKTKTVIEQKLEIVLDAIYDGKYEYALMECELVLALEPENVLGWKRLGSIYYALGKRIEAKDAWGKALKLDPNDKEISRFYQKVK